MISIRTEASSLAAVSSASPIPRDPTILRVAALTVLLTIPWVLTRSPQAWSAPYFIGTFAGSTPADTPDCGTGKGGSGQAHPCATLAYWNQQRRSVLRTGDIVRFAPGTYGPVGNASHCILPTRGVTYEGRTATDDATTSKSSVVIDLLQTPATAPCFARAIHCDVCDATDLVLRSMTFENAQSPYSGAWIHPGSTGRTNNVRLEHARFTGARQSGLVLGDVRGVPPFVWSMTNVVLDDCEFDHNGSLGNASSQHGLEIGLIDGFTLTNSLFHDNPGGGYSDNHDGIHVGGVRNGTFQNSTSWGNGQNGFSFTRTGDGLQCPETTYNIVAERLVAYGNFWTQFSFSGGVHDIVLRNSIAWGNGSAFDFYYSPHGIALYNNTGVSSGRALTLYSNQVDMTFENNLFISTGTAGPVVFIDQRTIGPGNGNVWRNNIIRGGPGMTAVVDNNYGESDPPGCSLESTYTGRVIPRITGGSYGDTSTGLAAWRTANRFPATLGGTAASDKWGQTPLFVDMLNPSIANLHLRPDDTVARGSGLVLGGTFVDDFDGQLRPQGVWDVGADEVISGTVRAPTLLSVDAIP